MQNIWYWPSASYHYKTIQQYCCTMFLTAVKCTQLPADTLLINVLVIRFPCRYNQTVQQIFRLFHQSLEYMVALKSWLAAFVFQPFCCVFVQSQLNSEVSPYLTIIKLPSRYYQPLMTDGVVINIKNMPKMFTLRILSI